MEVSFATSQLKRLCESEDGLRGAYGRSCATRIMARLADLRAATVLEEMRALPGRCHELDGRQDGRLALHLTEGGRLVFESQQPTPCKPHAGLEWKRVESVRIIEVIGLPLITHDEGREVKDCDDERC